MLGGCNDSVGVIACKDGGAASDPAAVLQQGPVLLADADVWLGALGMEGRLQQAPGVVALCVLDGLPVDPARIRSLVRRLRLFDHAPEQKADLYKMQMSVKRAGSNCCSAALQI